MYSKSNPINGKQHPDSPKMLFDQDFMVFENKLIKRWTTTELLKHKFLKGTQNLPKRILFLILSLFLSILDAEQDEQSLVK